MPQVYQSMVAGHPLRYAFLYPATRYYLRPLPRRVEGEDFDIAVTPDKIALGRNFLPPDSSCCATAAAFFMRYPFSGKTGPGF